MPSLSRVCTAMRGFTVVGTAKENDGNDKQLSSSDSYVSSTMKNQFLLLYLYYNFASYYIRLISLYSTKLTPSLKSRFTKGDKIRFLQ
jgi:hypothetical protein